MAQYAGAAALAGYSQPPYFPPPQPTGLAAIPTPVWIIAIGGGIFLMFKGGMFDFIGDVFGAAGGLVKSTGDLGERVIDGTGKDVVDPIFGIFGDALRGVGHFGNALFSNETRLFGGKSVIKVWPFSWFF